MRFTTEGLFIKISGITSEEDALFSVGLGANAIGFDFALGDRQIPVGTAHDIAGRLPSGVVTVGSFRNELPQRVCEIANTLGLTAVQIDGAISGDELSYITARVNTVLRTVPEGTEKLALWGGVDYLVLPESDERQALADALQQLADSGPRVPLIASGGLSADQRDRRGAELPGVWRRRAQRRRERAGREGSRPLRGVHRQRAVGL